jgi:hypothetical protein
VPRGTFCPITAVILFSAECFDNPRRFAPLPPGRDPSFSLSRIGGIGEQAAAQECEDAVRRAAQGRPYVLDPLIARRSVLVQAFQHEGGLLQRAGDFRPAVRVAP